MIIIVVTVIVFTIIVVIIIIIVIVIIIIVIIVIVMTIIDRSLNYINNNIIQKLYLGSHKIMCKRVEKWK